MRLKVGTFKGFSTVSADVWRQLTVSDHIVSQLTRKDADSVNVRFKDKRFIIV